MTRVAAVCVLAVLLMLGGAAAYAATVITETHVYSDLVTIQSKGRVQVFTVSGTITDLDTIPDPVTVTVTVGTTSTAPPDTQIPATPVLSLGAATQNTLTLSWLPGVDNVGVDHHDVYRGTGPTVSAQVKIAEVTGLSYTYTGLVCGTSYSLAVVAVDAAGNRSKIAEAIWYPATTLACSTTTTTPTPGTANLWVEPS